MQTGRGAARALSFKFGEHAGLDRGRHVGSRGRRTKAHMSLLSPLALPRMIAQLFEMRQVEIVAYDFIS